MPFNPQSRAKLDAFLRELSNSGLVASLIQSSIYKLGNHNISIRTTTKPGPVYWYDVSKTVIDKVDYFIYQMDSNHNFMLFPSSFFKERYNKLKDSNRQGAKIFYLDWNNKTIESPPSYKENIPQYCCSTSKSSEFGSWNELLYPAHQQPSLATNVTLDSDNCFNDINDHRHSFAGLNETEQKQIIDSRIGQNIFREMLISRWGRCSVTGCSQLDILIASHIKPWSASDNSERLDIDNGFLLIPNIDSLFDKGYITFDSSGLIRYSSQLSLLIAGVLGVNREMTVNGLSNGNLKYLAYHNKYVFKA